MSEPSFSAELPREPAASLHLVSRTAESWGGLWQAEGVAEGRLGIPVLAGLRHGWVAGPLRVRERPGGSRLDFTVEQSEYRVQMPAFLFLILAALGALTSLVAPFVPALLPLMPMGILLSVAAWFFIIARLRNSGPEEFFEDLTEACTDEAAPEP